MFKSKPEKVNPECKFALKQDQIIVKKVKVWPLTQLEQVFKRRFALMGQGLEIYTRDKKAYFFNLLTETAFTNFFNSFKGVVTRINKNARRPIIDVVDDVRAEFKNRKVFEAWNANEICTQEFLLLVNKYSGRSFNDFG
jgi:hypothetical protein